LTKPSANHPAGFLTFTLHAHLPYVVNHGTWPQAHGMLHEAAAETYLPFLRMLKNLERDKDRFNCNINLSPILLEQFSHPVFIAEFPTTSTARSSPRETRLLHPVRRNSSRRDRPLLAPLLSQASKTSPLRPHIIAAFRHFNDTGLSDIITCSHPRLHALLGTDGKRPAPRSAPPSTLNRHIGKHPRGIWRPSAAPPRRLTGIYPSSCPTGTPSPSYRPHRRSNKPSPESGLEFFFVDTPPRESPSASPRHTSF